MFVAVAAQSAGRRTIQRRDCTHSPRPSSWPSFGRMRKCCQFFHRWRTPAQAAHIRLWARCSFAVCDTRQLWQPAEDGPAGCLGKTTAGRPGPGPYRRPPLPVVQQTRSHSCSVLASLETARRSASAADHLDSRRHWAAVRPAALCTSGTSSVSPFTPGLEALALKQWHSSNGTQASHPRSQVGSCDFVSAAARARGSPSPVHALRSSQRKPNTGLHLAHSPRL